MGLVLVVWRAMVVVVGVEEGVEEGGVGAVSRLGDIWPGGGVW